MRLYKMELYKIYHNRAFIKACIVALAIWFIFFWFVGVGEEIATVDGVYYQGYKAVKINRLITEEFKGELTDEKLEKMVEKYGFPSLVIRNYPGFRDANYISTFVTDYFTDGYMYGWEEGEYKVPIRLYPIAETDIGKQEEHIYFYYTKGWNVLLDTFQMGMVLVSIIIIIGVSGLFAEESQLKVLPLLFTTQKGKREDIVAKLLAAFTMVISLYAVMTLLVIGLSYLVFGFDGAECSCHLVTGQYIWLKMSISSVAILVMVMGLLGLLSLYAMTVCISAHCRNNFHSVVFTAACWGLPVLIRMLFGGIGYVFVACTPVFLIMYNSVIEMESIFGVVVALVIACSSICVVNGYLAFKKLT